MKVLHLIYTKGIAGAENYLLSLLPGLKEAGYDCEFICVGPKKESEALNKYCNRMSATGIKTTLILKKSGLQFFSISKQINDYLKKNKINIIHSHLFAGDLLAVTIKKFFNRSIKILSTKHGYDEKFLIKYGSGYRRIPNNLYYLVSKYVNKHIDENVATSKFIAEMYGYLKLGKPGMKFIHHGININNNNLEDENKREQNIMVVGRLVEVKGHKFLIDALPLIVKEFPKLNLFILGEGDFKEELKATAERSGVLAHIQFVGFQNPELYINKCQVIVVPSMFEAFGMVFIEAFSLKIPVVAFNVGAGNEIVKQNETGLLAPPFDSRILAEKIIYLLQNPEERRRIAENAYQHFLQHFTTGKMVNKTVEWYNSII